MDEKKNVLIITYYWPPSAGSGVQRWLKFAQYLPEYGWNPIIFTPENPDFELKDESLLQKIPSGMEVLRFPIWEPYHLLRKLKKNKIKDPAVILEKKNKSFLDKIAIAIRANLLVPDPRVFWVKPSVEFLTDIAKKNNIKAVITTGPPHSLHLIGRGIKRKTGIPWIADFRDPWSSWEFLEMLPMIHPVKKKHLRLEQSVLKEADAVITISPTFKEELEHLGERKVNLITNGFDSAELPQFQTKPADNRVFNIVYTGIIDSIRNPLPFLAAFKNAFIRDSEKDVLLTLVGKVSTQVTETIQEDHWLSSHVELTGYVSHQKVIDYYQKADMLLLILTHTKNAKGNIPGKLFEYMATGRPIVALGDPQGDASSIIRTAKAGQVFPHEAVGEIERFIKEAAYSSQDQSGRDLDQFERKALTGRLAELLNETTDPIS